MKPLLLAVALLSAALAVQAQTIYRWVDADGKVRYSDKPPASAKAKPVEPRVTSPGSAPAQASPRQAAGQEKKAELPEVRMFATDWCPYCRQAREYFARNGIRYTELDIEKSAAAKAEYDRIGGRGVPVIFVGPQRMNGFSEASFARMLSGAK